MANTLYRHADLSTATYGTPVVADMKALSFTVSETASPTEIKDDQGSVLAVAIPETVQEISISGYRTGTFSATVGDTLAITMPASVTLGATTIVTGLTTTYAAEQFEQIEMTVRSYKTVMSAS
jgi:hypothetical protein